MIVRYEDSKWINNIGVYFFIVNEININLFKLITCESDNIEEIELLFFNIAADLNRIIPMKYRKISFDDGILKLHKHLIFLQDDFNNLFSNYSSSLININDIRNKFEHVPHIIKWKKYIGNNISKKISFINDEYNYHIIEGNKEEIKKREKRNEKLNWEIDTDTFIKIVIEIDKIFIKIQNQLKDYFINNDVVLNHPYIKRIININLSNYIIKLNNYVV